MNAANYLELKSVMLSTCQHTANLLSGRTPAEIKAFLGVSNEDTDEEIDEDLMAQVEKLTVESYARKRGNLNKKKK